VGLEEKKDKETLKKGTVYAPRESSVTSTLPEALGRRGKKKKKRETQKKVKKEVGEKSRKKRFEE